MVSDDPRLNIAGKTDYRPQKTIKLRKKAEPPPNQVKPDPDQVIRRIAYIAQHYQCPITQANAYMIILVLFYFSGLASIPPVLQIPFLSPYHMSNSSLEADDSN